MTVYVKTKRQAKLLALMIKKEKNDDTKSLVCPMPGLIVSLDVTEGDIFIDEQNINSVKLSSLRKSISLVSQDIILFDDTVRANILYANMNATEEEFKKAFLNSSSVAFIFAYNMLARTVSSNNIIS